MLQTRLPSLQALKALPEPCLLFLGDITNISLDKYIAGMFVVAMLALIGSFVFLLREIFIASAAMRSHRHVRRPLK